MRYLLLASVALLGIASLPDARAEDFLAVTPGAGANVGGKSATGGGFHAGPMVCDATDPRICGPVSATIGLGVNVTDGANVVLGHLADTASNGANATIASMLHQANVNNTAGSAAPGATSASAAAIQGAIASGGAQTGSPLPDGCRAATAEPTAVADGQAVLIKCAKDGRVVMAPWAVPDLYLRGKATVVITTPATLLAASGVGAQFTYLTSMQCGNSSATGVWVTLSDGNATLIYVPPTGGNNPVFSPPLVSSALNTAITVVGDSTQTTVRCAAEGYRGL